MNDVVALNPATTTIRLHAGDNVVVARVDLPQGAAVAEEGLTCLNRIPAGHKVAARAIARANPSSSTAR